MTTREPAYWDTLGVAWTAIDPDIAVIAPRIKARLRLQSVGIRIGLLSGAVVAPTSFALGCYTIWHGFTTGAWHFVTRGIAILVISALVAMAIAAWLPVRASEAAHSLSDMLELAIARARRMLMMTRLGLSACAVAALFGLAGFLLRSNVAGPPALSPIIDLLILALFAGGLVLYGDRAKMLAMQLRALKRVLTTGDDR